MTPISKWLLGALLLLPAEGGAWDYTTSNPCDTPVEHHASPDVAATTEGSVTDSYSATVDLNIPLSSRVHTESYNADLSGSEIDVGTALVTQDGTYLNVLGNEITSAPADISTAATGCR